MALPHWLRYGFPSICLVLGSWQLYRLQWKNQLIADLTAGLHRAPLKVDHLDEDDLEGLKHRRIKLHALINDTDKDKAIFMGPRIGREVGADFAYDFYLPVELTGDHRRVLVNWGKVPVGKEHKITLPEGAEQWLEVMVEEGERRPWLVPPNEAAKGIWTHRNVQEMSQHANTDPYLFRRITSRKISMDSVPIATIPKIEVPNRHLEYVITWYGIAAASYALSFIKR